MAQLWPEIEPHVLFNKLNNMEPLLILDSRENTKFQEIHLKKSSHITRGNVLENLKSIVNENLSQSFVKSIKAVVLVLDKSEENDLSILMKEIETSVNQEIPREIPLQLLYVDSEKFWDRYKNCEYLLNSILFSDETKKRLRFRSQYYATELIPNFLFLGDYQNGSEQSQLKALGITHIIDATNEHYSEESAKELSINYLPIDVWDIEKADISQYFESTNKFIQSAREQNGKVLCHCRAGWSRSPSIVLAYLISSKFSPSLREALVWTVSQRPFVFPNTGFRDQLRRYEFNILGTQSFESDNETVQTIHSNSRCWSGDTTSESDFDRISINAMKKKKFNIEEFSEPMTSQTSRRNHFSREEAEPIQNNPSKQIIINNSCVRNS